MKPAYDNALMFLRDWVRDTNNLLLGRQTAELFKGAFLAYRNPNMHENKECTQKEAFERITLASQMISVLTQGR